MLPYEHSYTDTAHVEAVKESLDIVVNLHTLSFALVFKNALRDRGDDRIVPALDLLERLGEPVVVVFELRRPRLPIIRDSIVSATGLSAVAVGLAWLRRVFPFLHAGVLRHGAELLRDLAAFAILSSRSEEARPHFFGY